MTESEHVKQWLLGKLEKKCTAIGIKLPVLHFWRFPLSPVWKGQWPVYRLTSDVAVEWLRNNEPVLRAIDDGIEIEAIASRESLREYSHRKFRRAPDRPAKEVFHDSTH